jgi:peptidoglycan/LPS O-acetylase OafA/YrhL
MVAVFHYPLDSTLNATPLVSHSFMFVDFFFVLSGFVIAYGWESRIPNGEGGKFLFRRWARLYPLHLVMLGLFVAVAAAKGAVGSDEAHSTGAILSNLLLIQGLGVHANETWNWPAWSISVEAALYVLFALLVALKANRWFYVILAGIGFAALFMAPADSPRTYDFGFFRGLAGFFVGALLTRLPVLKLGTASEVAAVALALAFVMLGELTALAALAFAPAVYVLARSEGAVSKVLNWKPLIHLGAWSYGIYMIHALLVAGMRALAGPLGLHFEGGELEANLPIMADVYLPFYLFGVVLLGGLSYVYFEKPLMDLASRKRPVPA